MAKHIKCAQCQFVQIDEDACESDWTAYACSNRDSDFFMALLNVTSNGNTVVHIIWGGCEYGKAVES